MNEVIDAIRKRRSVRAYHSKPLPRDIVAMIIEAGNEAPSPMNSQPWRFVVIEDSEVKKKLLRAALPHARKILDLVKESDPVRYEAITKRLSELPDPVYYSAPVIVFVSARSSIAGNCWSRSCPASCRW